MDQGTTYFAPAGGFTMGGRLFQAGELIPKEHFDAAPMHEQNALRLAGGARALETHGVQPGLFGGTFLSNEDKQKIQAKPVAKPSNQPEEKQANLFDDMHWKPRHQSLFDQPQQESAPTPQPQQKDQYHRGDKISLTGKTQNIHGQEFEEFTYLEGAKKGQTGVRPTTSQQLKNLDAKMQARRDQQSQFAALHNAQSQQSAAPPPTAQQHGVEVRPHLAKEFPAYSSLTQNIGEFGIVQDPKSEERKLKAAGRALQRERDKSPLFSDQVAAIQETPEQRRQAYKDSQKAGMIQGDIDDINRWHELDDHLSTWPQHVRAEFVKHVNDRPNLQTTPAMALDVASKGHEAFQAKQKAHADFLANIAKRKAENGGDVFPPGWQLKTAKPVPAVDKTASLPLFQKPAVQDAPEPVKPPSPPPAPVQKTLFSASDALRESGEKLSKILGSPSTPPAKTQGSLFETDEIAKPSAPPAAPSSDWHPVVQRHEAFFHNAAQELGQPIGSLNGDEVVHEGRKAMHLAASENPDATSAYLRSAAKNRMIDHVRFLSKSRAENTKSIPQLSQLPQSEREAAFSNAVDIGSTSSTPSWDDIVQHVSDPSHHQILNLRFKQGKQIADVARELGMSIDQVKRASVAAFAQIKHGMSKKDQFSVQPDDRYGIWSSLKSAGNRLMDTTERAATGLGNFVNNVQDDVNRVSQHPVAKQADRMIDAAANKIRGFFGGSKPGTPAPGTTSPAPKIPNPAQTIARQGVNSAFTASAKLPEQTRRDQRSQRGDMLNAAGAQPAAPQQPSQPAAPTSGHEKLVTGPRTFQVHMREPIRSPHDTFVRQGHGDFVVSNRSGNFYLRYNGHLYPVTHQEAAVNFVDGKMRNSNAIRSRIHAEHQQSEPYPTNQVPKGVQPTPQSASAAPSPGASPAPAAPPVSAQLVRPPMNQVVMTGPPPGPHDFQAKEDRRANQAWAQASRPQVQPGPPPVQPTVQPPQQQPQRPAGSRPASSLLQEPSTLDNKPEGSLFTHRELGMAHYPPEKPQPGQQAAQPPVAQPRQPAPPVVGQPAAPAQPAAAFGPQLHRNFKFGQNNVSAEFENEMHRDLYDFYANWKFQPSGKASQVRQKKPVDFEGIANKYGLDVNQVLPVAGKVYDDVKAQMRGMKDGEHRKLKMSPMGNSPAPAPAPQPAPAPAAAPPEPQPPGRIGPNWHKPDSAPAQAPQLSNPPPSLGQPASAPVQQQPAQPQREAVPGVVVPPRGHPDRPKVLDQLVHDWAASGNGAGNVFDYVKKRGNVKFGDISVNEKMRIFQLADQLAVQKGAARPSMEGANTPNMQTGRPLDEIIAENRQIQQSAGQPSPQRQKAIEAQANKGNSGAVNVLNQQQAAAHFNEQAQRDDLAKALADDEQVTHEESLRGKKVFTGEPGSAPIDAPELRQKAIQQGLDIASKVGGGDPSQNAKVAWANLPQSHKSMFADKKDFAEAIAKAFSERHASGAKLKDRAHSGAPPLEQNQPASPQPQDNAPASSSGVGRVGKSADVHVVGWANPIPSRYEVMELKDVQASHNYWSGGSRTNPNFPKGLQPRDYSPGTQDNQKVFDHAAAKLPDYYNSEHPDATNGPPTLSADNFALNGNGRVHSLQLAAGRSDYDWLKNDLINKAHQFGIDPEQVRGMEHPVLVRKTNLTADSELARQFAKDGNLATTHGQNQFREAASMSHMIDDDLLHNIQLEGDETMSDFWAREKHPVMEEFRRNLPSTLQATYFTPKGMLTPKGKQLMSDILLSKVLPAETLEKTAANQSSLLRAIEGAVPQLLALKQHFNVKSALSQAVDFLNANPEIVNNAILDESQRQLGLFEKYGKHLSPEGMMFGEFLLNHRGKAGFSVNGVRKALKDVLEVIQFHGGLFGSESTEPEHEEIARLMGVKPREGAKFRYSLSWANLLIERFNQRASRYIYAPEAV